MTRDTKTPYIAKMLTEDQEKEQRTFLREEVIPLAEEALKKLYPARDYISSKGTESLYLLYVPCSKVTLDGRLTGRLYPQPYGDVSHEWIYLEGEIKGFDWKEIEKEKFSKDFPDRNPPFPVPKWPVWNILGKRYVERGRVRALWLLFINLIPIRRWEDILMILFNHQLRFSKLSRLVRDKDTVKEIEKNLLPAEVGTKHLVALSYLSATLQDEDAKKLFDCTRELMRVLYKYDHLSAEGFPKKREEIEQECCKEWEELKGPQKEYRKEASRYLQPLVCDLFEYLNASLLEDIEEELDNWVGRGPRARWARGGKNSELNKEEVFRIIGDLIRFSLIALSGNEIVMGDMSELTPIDIQMERKGEMYSVNAMIRSFGALNELFKDTSEEDAPYPWKAMANKLDPVEFQEWIDASNLMETHARTILSMNKSFCGKSDEIISRLTEGYPTHSYTITIEEAKEIFREHINHNKDPNYKELWKGARMWVKKYLGVESSNHIIRYILPRVSKES